MHNYYFQSTVEYYENICEETIKDEEEYERLKLDANTDS